VPVIAELGVNLRMSGKMEGVRIIGTILVPAANLVGIGGTPSRVRPSRRVAILAAIGVPLSFWSAISPMIWWPTGP
jgi:hypothetical protein